MSILLFAPILLRDKKHSSARNTSDLPITVEKPKDISLKDVKGMHDVKEELKQYIEFFTKRDVYLERGATLPKGVLFQGPPGCGKTHIARCIAGECNVPFINVNCSSMNDMFVGVGANKIRRVFALARKNSPCIIFMDEIDSIGAKRSSFSNNIEHSNNLNAMLVEMDGFQKTESIFIIAASNRAESLDPALMRSGRFDRHLHIDKPNEDERGEIFKMYVDKIKMQPTQNINEIIKYLSSNTPGVSCADIANIVNLAAIISVRKKTKFVTREHLMEAYDEHVIGMKRESRTMCDRELEIVAYHEAGHAILGYMLDTSSPPIKVSIVPRGKDALGFSQPKPETKYLYTKDELLSDIVVLYGGRAAEQIFFDSVTTGASDDIERATKIAYQMVTTFGLEDGIGCINHNDKDKIFSKKGDDINSQVDEILHSVYDYALKLLKKHKKDVARLAKLLLKKKTITDKDIKIVFGDELNNKYHIDI